MQKIKEENNSMLGNSVGDIDNLSKEEVSFIDLLATILAAKIVTQDSKDLPAGNKKAVN